MENIIKQLNEYVEEALFYYDLPGLVVSACAEGLNFKKAAGVRDITTKDPLKEEDIFHMASVSKLFTSTGIMQLVAAGKLSLDSKLAEVLPYVSIDDERYKEITIRHMLTHTSGMTEVTEYHWDKPRIDEEALKDYACSSDVKDSHLLWHPNEKKFRYSDMAYEVLGQVISEISGMTFEDYMKKMILVPLEMNDSTFLTFERAGGSLRFEDLRQVNMALPHTKDSEKHIALESCYPYNRQHAPSSTLTTNVFDLEKWAKAHLERRLFSEEMYDMIWKKYTVVPNNGEGMGLGWFMRSQEGLDIYGHEGTDEGFRASFWICPQLSAHVTVASNISRGAVKRISKKIYEILIRSL